jgi:hypothetical protein
MEYTPSFSSSQSRELISLVPGRLAGVYTVRLNLPFGPVFIGELRTGGEGTYFKRVDPSKHVHHNSDSVAISAALLTAEHIGFRWIVCDIKGHGKIVTTRPYMLTHGEAFRYPKYEPQIALPVNLWGKELALEWEQEQARRERIRRELRAQGSLFEAVA